MANWIANHTTKKPKTEKEKVELREELLGVSEGGCEPFNRAKRGQLIKKHCINHRPRLMLYAFEGFGKSYLTILWAQNGQKVLFGCNSNVQAEEQARGFKKQSCRVQLIVSREHRLQNEYQVEVEKY